MDDSYIKIILFEPVDLNNAVLVFGYPSIGLTSKLAVNYVIKHREMKQIGCIESSEFPSIRSTFLGNTISHIRIFGKKQLDDTYIVAILMEFKPDNIISNILSDAIIKWAKNKGCRLIIALDGMIGIGKSNDKQGNKKTYALGSTENARIMLLDKNIPQFKNGIVAGPSGVFLNKSFKEGLDVISLLSLTNPPEYDFKAASALIFELTKILKNEIKHILPQEMNTYVNLPKELIRDPDNLVLNEMLNYELNKSINIFNFEKIDVSNSIVFIGFPSIGLIGTVCANYLVDFFKLKQIGCVESIDFPAISNINNGVPHQPLRIYAGTTSKNKKIVVFLSDFKPDLKIQSKLSNKISSWIKENRCESVFSSEGMLFKEEKLLKFGAKIYGLASNEYSTNLLNKNKLETYRNGVIEGINAYLLQQGSIKELNMITFLVQANPKRPDAKSAGQVLKSIEKITGVNINLAPLYKEEKRIEKMRNKFEKKQK